MSIYFLPCEIGGQLYLTHVERIVQLYFNPSTVKMLSNLKVHFSCPTQMSCFSCISVYAYITPFMIQTSLGTGHSCSSEIYNEKEVLCYSGKVDV